MIFIMVKPYAVSKLEPVDICITPLTVKKLKSAKKSSVFDHNASFNDFETVAKESDEFRLPFRESFLIWRDNPPLDGYVKSIPQELFS